MSFPRLFIYTVVFGFFISGNLYSQEKNSDFTDTLILMTGKKIITRVTDTTLYGAKILTKRRKEMLIEGDQIYSIKFPDGHEKIIYYEDSSAGNDLTLKEARLYIKGEQDAEKLYRPVYPMIGGFFIGAASLSLGSLLSVIPPFAFSACMMIPKIKPRPSGVSDISMIGEETYIMGYEKVAKKKKAFRAFGGGIAGMATGIIGIIIYQKTR